MRDGRNLATYGHQCLVLLVRSPCHPLPLFNKRAAKGENSSFKCKPFSAALHPNVPYTQCVTVCDDGGNQTQQVTAAAHRSLNKAAETFFLMRTARWSTRPVPGKCPQCFRHAFLPQSPNHCFFPIPFARPPPSDTIPCVLTRVCACACHNNPLSCRSSAPTYGSCC